MNKRQYLPYDVHELRERLHAGETFTYRHFYGHTPQKNGRLSNAVFSQFYTCRFEIDGQAYYWAEQWMMAGKARLFDDTTSLHKILGAHSPQECKQFGREVANYNNDMWNAARFDLVTKGNVAKFGQNEGLKAYLLETGNEILAEAAAQDKIWGTGLDRGDPLANDPLQWPGLNLLGFALIRAREILRSKIFVGGSHE
jgi:ribA/ribD-fused uncharacterized protein